MCVSKDVQIIMRGLLIQKREADEPCGYKDVKKWLLTTFASNDDAATLAEQFEKLTFIKDENVNATFTRLSSLLHRMERCNM